MSEVIFNPRKKNYVDYHRNEVGKSSQLTRWLIKSELAKNEQQANYILLSIATAAIILAIIIFSSASEASNQTGDFANYPDYPDYMKTTP